MVEESVQPNSFTSGYPVVPEPSVDQNILSPFSKINQLQILRFISVILFQFSLCVFQLYYSFGYCSFVVSFYSGKNTGKVGSVSLPTLLIIFKIIFVILGPLDFHLILGSPCQFLQRSKKKIYKTGMHKCKKNIYTHMYIYLYRRFSLKSQRKARSSFYNVFIIDEVFIENADQPSCFRGSVAKGDGLNLKYFVNKLSVLLLISEERL